VIPPELLELPQWVAWRLETRQTPKGPRETKVPYDPHQAGWRAKASSTDPSTWGTYQQALVAGRPSNRVGFVFSPDDPYVGVDMDNCVSPSGAVHRGAYEVVKRLGGYVEFSPSGLGLHIIVRGSIERGRHTLKTPWGDELAVYDRGRFFTMLGNGRGELRDSQAALDALIEEFFPAPVVKAPVRRSQPLCDDDTALIDRMLQDGRVAALWRGDMGEFNDDHSAADLALCAHLAFFTANDADRMDALFRRSGLMRDKWDQPRGTGTYGSATITRALRF